MEAIKFTREMIAFGQSEGVFRPGDPDLIFEASAGVINSSVITVLTHQKDPTMVKQQGFDLFWAMAACPLTKQY